MGILSDILRFKERIAQSWVRDPVAYYVIDPDHHATYTQEIVDLIGRAQPMVDIGSGGRSSPPTYAEVEASIIAGSMEIMGVKIHYTPFSAPEISDEKLSKVIATTPNCIVALQTLVEANARYVEMTGRPQDAIAIHPRHARELLELFANKS